VSTVTVRYIRTVCNTRMLSYRDTRPGGAPDAIVLLHGLLVDGGLWDGVVERLDRRAVVIELPLGCHTVPLPDAADRTAPGVAAMVAEVLDHLDLNDVTLVGNDTGGAIAQLVAADHGERVGRLVLTPCDVYENFLPKIFRPLQWAARTPGGLTAMLWQARLIAPIRRLPFGFGRLIKRPAPHKAWVERCLDAYLKGPKGVRRDVIAFTRAIDPAVTLGVAERLESFTKPVLFAWAPEDKSFTMDWAERLAAALPDARIERIEDSYTFTPLDQPDRTAELIGSFAA
jgi:pimeloyl-ACP methyl ester carboxylesterase